jgi:hypothetical protein
MESDKVFYCTHSKENISYSYYAARKYLYLLISDPFMNILANLQFKIDRLIAGSSSITEDVVIQLTRDFDFRMRRVEKEARGASLNEIEDLSSLKNIFYFFLYAVKKGVKLFAEVVNLSFNICWQSRYLVIIYAE